MAGDAVDPQAPSQHEPSTRDQKSVVLSADAAALIAEMWKAHMGDLYERAEWLNDNAHRIDDLLRALQQERDEAYGYLSRLFHGCAPQCDVLPDILGVATQIDNYIAGLRQERDALKAEKERLKAPERACPSCTRPVRDGVSYCPWCKHHLGKLIVPEPLVMTPLDVLRKVVAANGSQKETARVLCISPQYLCDILHGRREISAEVAEILGFERVVTYVEKRPEPLPAPPAEGTP